MVQTADMMAVVAVDHANYQKEIKEEKDNLFLKN
jgi:hypothetical protein